MQPVMKAVLNMQNNEKLSCQSGCDQNEDIDLEGIDMIRKYLREYTLNARPLCENSMGAVSDMGKLFQGYVLGQCEEDSFFEQAKIV